MPVPADVTVVVCSRNRPESLANALRRIAEVTPPEVEVLVVDSASDTPETLEVARAAGVTSVRTDTKGLSIARNIGLAHSERPIVVYTDDDCAPDPQWIERIAAALSDPEVGAVTGRLVDEKVARGLSDAELAAGTPTRYTTVRRGVDAGHGALMAFRRELITRLGGFDEVLGAGRRFAGAEDLDMFCRVLADGAAIVHEPRAIMRHLNVRDDEAFVALLHGYGLGLGGLVTKWLRLAPRHGIALAVDALGRTVVRFVRRIGSRRERRGQFAMFRGILSGMAISTRFRLDGTRFVDTDPPAPTRLAGGMSDTGSTR